MEARQARSQLFIYTLLAREYWVILMANQNVYSAVITKGEIAYVAYCPELGVVSQGKTEEKAIENLREAVQLYLEDEDVQENLRKHPVQLAHVTPLIVPT